MDVEQFYTAEARSYDLRRWTGPVGSHIYDTYQRLVDASLPILPGARYLEIGCGTGRFTVPLSRHPIDLTAIDISDGMLAETRARLASTPLARVTLKKVDARDTGWASESFDVVYSFNVINHVPGFEKVIEEAARLLRPKGTLVLGFPSLWSLYLPYAAVVNATKRSLRRGVYTRWPSVAAIRRQASTLKLEVISDLGMFHCPPIRPVLFASAVAGILRFANKRVNQGGLRHLATTRILAFRKDG